MRFVLQSVLAALSHLLSFSMTQSNFATNPEHGEIHRLFTESQLGQKLPFIPGFYYIVR